VQAPFVRRLRQGRKRSLRAAYSVPSMLYGLVAASQMVFALGAEVKHVYGVDVNDPAFVEAHAQTVFSMMLGASAAKRASGRITRS
jgi:hypothetical protein